MLTKKSVSCLILVLLVALVPISASARNVKAIHGVFMNAEGVVPMPTGPDQPMPVISPSPLNLPDFLMGPIAGNVLNIYSITHVENSMATLSVMLIRGPEYKAGTGAMNGVPDVPVFPGGPTWRQAMLDENGELKQPGFPISVFNVALDAVILGDGQNMVEGVPVPAHTIAFIGTIVSNPVPSPFGELTGRAAAFSAEFDNLGDSVNFKFVGGFVAGSHSTWAMEATGALRISGYYLQQ